MSRIRSKDSEPEKQVRSMLVECGTKFSSRVATPGGKPDFVHKRRKQAIFVHGCYWHRHSCRRGQSTPSTNTLFWLKKFARNIARDRRNNRELKALGWKVLVVWECQLKKPNVLRRRLAKFLGIS